MVNQKKYILIGVPIKLSRTIRRTVLVSSGGGGAGTYCQTEFNLISYKKNTINQSVCHSVEV